MAALDLRTSRLHLRPVRPDDARATAALMDDEIASYLTTWPPDMSPRQARARIAVAEERLAQREAVELAILRRSTEQLLGWISFIIECPGSGAATIGFWLGREHQGQGLMTEAAAAAIPAAADFLDVRALEAFVYPWNSASIALARKLGFRAVGGTAFYSPVRKQTEEAFLFRRKIADSEFAPRAADAA